MVPFLHITTQLEGRAHDNLLTEMGGRGFPSMRFIDGDGNVWGKPSGNQVAAFESTLVDLQRIQQLEQRIDGGEQDLDDDLFLAKLRMGVIPFVFAKAKAATFDGYSEEEKAEVAQLLINLEVESLLARRKTAEGDQKCTTRFLQMIEANTLPIGDTLGDLWHHLHLVADREQDVVLFERSLLGMKAFHGIHEETKAFFDTQDLRLQELRDKAAAHD